MEGKERIDNLRKVGRKLLSTVWKQYKRGGPLNPKEERIASILEEHPEFFDFWEGGGESDHVVVEGKALNPYLHIQMHLMVESQIEGGKPKEVSETLERLTDAGVPRHEAVHRIITALVPEIYRSMAEKRPLDEGAYAGILGKIEI